MYKGLCYLAVGLLLAACMESGDPPASDQPFAPIFQGRSNLPVESDRSFVPGERIGGITPGMPMSRVENLYGSDNLESRDLPAGEGTTIPGYVLFPGQYDELYIELGEDKQPARARFTNPRSNWTHATTGLIIGSTLEDLRRMNGRGFVFRGFGWDYGGTVSDWRGGRLKNILVRLTYTPERLGPGTLPDSLVGDVPIDSDTPGLDELGLRVREISVPIRPEEEVK
ncbi:hypothetical protein [Neolewinella litorea]|uniref:Lipoprotein n=1 Tax=Neolewinella litorea TaxID=2562452 RepID=A0A4S4NTP2_9BACT|nr:hypothetical protein [Neolewinella litorea]THH41861.1 hypothetical protein E4021_04540 [Neolewinella litorea]